VSFSFPFTSDLSKNSLWGVSHTGQVYTKSGAKRAMKMVEVACRAALGAQRVARQKLWLNIFVHMPSHRTDAVNVVDALCDGIKRAIPLNDNWFAIDRLNWAICKTKPMVTVTLTQDTDQDCRICSQCSAIRPDVMYRTPSARECLDCHPAKPTVITVDDDGGWSASDEDESDEFRNG